MLIQGKALTVEINDSNHIATMVFDLLSETNNRFNQLTLSELKQAVDALARADSFRGLLIKSAKDTFSVGADVTEFATFAKWPAATLIERLREVNSIFNTLEDLPYPTVVMINGMALGGGLEFALSCDYRVMSENAKIGFPEVNLGLIPGWGGTVRAPRLVGADNAMEWIAGGRQFGADKALAVGMVDAVVADDQLEAASVDLLNQVLEGRFDYRARRLEKTTPLKLDEVESTMVFMVGKAMVGAKAPKGMVAPVAAVETMQQHARLHRAEALEIEHQAWVTLAQGDVSPNLVAIFLNDKALIKGARRMSSGGAGIRKAAVLGAGIMGGGIAYQSAVSGIPIVMKDIDQAGIDAGMAEASSLLSKRVDRGRLTAGEMAQTLTRINPTLHYAEMAEVDCLVEAIVENEAIKKTVLAEVEGLVRQDTVIASNTSTIPITALATALKRPENFCGMHFFNPVHLMPLVEIIRGEKTSDETVARTVAYALAMNKKPVVVNDCPGFLVNRILFGYFAGFSQLLYDGADFRSIDKAAEKFGWPMGPAYLADVVGIDTAVHAGQVMASGFPSRMSHPFKNGMEVMLEAGRLGQKNGAGFYRYEAGRKGRPEKHFDESVLDILAPHVGGPKSFTEKDIINRLMTPLCFESVRCLEDGIASSADEIDLALVYGVGFPPFRGGVFRYMESVGLNNFLAMAEPLSHLGELYQPTAQLKEYAVDGQSLLQQ